MAGFQPLQSCSSSLSILLNVWQVRFPLMLRLAVHAAYPLLTNGGQKSRTRTTTIGGVRPWLDDGSNGKSATQIVPLSADTDTAHFSRYARSPETKVAKRSRLSSVALFTIRSAMDRSWRSLKRFGMATAFIPARLAARQPGSESSKATA